MTVASQETSAGRQAAIQAGARAEAMSGPAARILIVDDHKFDRMRLKRLCGGLDFATRLAEADSLAAMARALDEGRYDLILLDYNLPDGTGLQGMDIIRAHGKNAGAATVMITGTDQTEVAIAALRGGFCDYIDKDELSPATLRRSVINALQKSTLQLGLETQEFQRSQVEELLQKFSGEGAEEIKPIVSLMLGQIRDLRGQGPTEAVAIADGLADMERSCLRLWEFLEDLSSYEADNLTKEALADLQCVRGLGAGRRKPGGKPPSPFRAGR
ncbi:response regulator [Sulfitobacter sp. S0837]|uniref:response regulator n=1 Tax=Sulfitobacter maritimus TaxID=2741719 RepID=UPI001583AA38|nr:response regulator [Sulfitobacter maritimus]NUH67214.1 response regulator [Sulfitobacter maritimus]